MNFEKRAEFSEEDDAENSDVNNAEYFAKVKSLNEDFLRWIQEFMAQSPYYIFTPVCKEYIQYMNSVDKEFGKKSKRGRPRKKVDSTALKVNDKQVNNVDENMSASQPSSSSQDVHSTASSQNSATFEWNKSAPSTSSNLMFKFGVDNKRAKSDTETKNVIGPDYFSQSKPKPNLDTIPEKKQNDEAMTTGEDEPYQPPKPESVIIEENDCVYSKRCKVYYKKDGSFVERGIGTLYVKKQANEKYQLLIRADTTLGNILLNIQLHPSLPLSVSKNGVLLTCIPNPPISISSKANDQSSVCFFIKVRNENDAKDLLKNLNEYSGK